MLISTLNCEMWPNFSYRGVRLVPLLLLLLLLMVFSSENFGFSPPYVGIAGIGPDLCDNDGRVSQHFSTGLSIVTMFGRTKILCFSIVMQSS